MMLRDKILAGLTALLLVGAGARLARSAETPRVVWPEIPSAPELPQRAAAEARAAAVDRALTGNVFSASRTPPGVRFRPGVEPEAPARPDASQPPPPPPPAPPRYRVAGTMATGNGQGYALIDADASTPAPEVYRPGDAVGGYRLERIAYDHVVLVGAAGEVRMNVARAGEARRVPARTGTPQSRADEPAPARPRATSSASTPPGAIPPGW